MTQNLSDHANCRDLPMQVWVRISEVRSIECSTIAPRRPVKLHER